MPYLTSWDINVFLCLLTWGLPSDVVNRMMKMTKKAHRDYTLGEAMTYWVSNSPTLVKETFPKNEFRKYKFDLDLKLYDKVGAREKFCSLADYLTFSTLKFKQEWRYRSVEERHQKVVNWCKFGEEEDQLRHQGRLRIVNHSPLYNNDYTKNLWKTWEAGATTDGPAVSWDRRVTISKWYEGIHPGRFFLFYRENKILEERNRGVPKGPCKDGYVYPRTPIYDWGPYEQLIEDLRCIDGSGLGEKVGKTVEHIDDMFLKV
jgi:hypothetical protein